MNYTATDVVRKISLPARLDPERITYMLFLSQYSIYKIGPIKTAIKYMYAGQPITRLKFWIGHKYKYIIQTDLPDSEWIGLYNLPPPVENRIFNTWANYDNNTNQKLRHEIRKKLNLIPIEKQGDYFGIDVDSYLASEGFKTIKKEI
jgi:hypothetical protein